MMKLTESLKKMLNALAHAHAGEFLTPRQKADYMANVTVTSTQQSIELPEEMAAPVTGKGRRRVAMYMGSELPPAVMQYVIETCNQLNHDLTVLTFEAESTAKALLQPYSNALDADGIAMKIAYLTGETIPNLARYLRTHNEIAFMACKENGYLGRSYLNGTQRKDALPVPVVVVVTDGRNAGTQVEEKTASGKISAA